MKLKDLIKVSVCEMTILYIDENDNVTRFHAEPDFLGDGTILRYTHDLPFENRNDWDVYLNYEVERVNASENEMIVFIKSQEK